MSHGPEPGGADVVGGGDVGVDEDCVHCWLLWPLHDQRMVFVPFAVAAPLASTHSPDCTPVMVPLVLRFHCWLVCPLQSQMITWVPLVVPLPLASRHLLPYTCNCLLEV